MENIDSNIPSTN